MGVRLWLLLVDILFRMILPIIIVHFVIGALLGVLKKIFRLGNLIVVSFAEKIHPVHALLREPPLAREIEMRSYAIRLPVHICYGCR